MIEPIRVAFVGAGGMAREHIRAFHDVPNVAIGGIHSRTRAKAEALAAEFGIPFVCDSIEKLYDKTKAQLVVITVFETAMREVAVSCCQYPWQLFLEKPPGMDVVDANAIALAVRQHSANAYVALNRRFLSSTRAAISNVNTVSGRRYIRVLDQQSLEVARSLGHPESVVHRWMFANSIHVIDYLRLFGRGAIRAVVPVEPWIPDQPDVVLARVDFESGDIGFYEGIWNGPGPWAVTVVTPQSRWEMRPLEEATVQFPNDRKQHPIVCHEWDKQFKPGFRLQAEHVISAVRGLESDSPSLNDAIETMELIAAIFRTCPRKTSESS